VKTVVIAFTVVLPLLTSCHSQQATQENKSQEKKFAPTLGFNHIKDVPPILDSDAYAEELELKKRLPGNPLVEDKRAIHEAAMMNDFLERFQDAEECNGITFQMGEDKKPAFTVQIAVTGHDNHPEDQSWTWILSWPGDPSAGEAKTHGVGGMGIQSSSKLTAIDVCKTVWDDVDPNHFKKPGGTIQR
jgi:hypothetical protein